MKNCYISEILICSLKEQKARKVSFNRTQTIILAGNNAGKSILLKSIYYAFGATPIFDKRWKEAYASVLVTFFVNDQKYKILRSGDSCGLFNDSDTLITNFKASNLYLNKVMSEIFDFHMVWNNKEGKTVIPPPAFMFLPYYIDQDVSWASNWKGFDRLNSLSNWRGAMIEYHTGLKPNEYYKSKTLFALKTKKFNEYEREFRLLKSLLKDINASLTKVDLSLNIEEFKNEINSLLEEFNHLQTKESEYKQTLNSLHSQKNTIDGQLKITTSVLNELKKDLNFAASELNDIIECPTCGATYDNNFDERFAIAKDESKCFEILNHLLEEKEQLVSKINLENRKLATHAREISKIRKILDHKQEQISLKDIIESQGKLELKKVFNEKLALLQKEKADLLLELSDLQKIIKSFTDKEHRKAILTFYRDKMKTNLRLLDIVADENDYKKIDTPLKDLGLGSDTSRSYLAYYFSILEVIKKYGSATFFPIIIDEPNQQGQDNENMPKILKFISDNQPKGTQLILGVENTRDVAFKGDVFQIEGKRQLLQRNNYKELNEEINIFIDKLLAHRFDDDPQLTLF